MQQNQDPSATPQGDENEWDKGEETAESAVDERDSVENEQEGHDVQQHDEDTADTLDIDESDPRTGYDEVENTEGPEDLEPAITRGN